MHGRQAASAWDGARNFADLGGYGLRDGTQTRHRRVWRSAAHEWISEAGWRAAHAAGLRRVIDLRNDMERGRTREHPVVDADAVAGIEFVKAPTEDPTDAVFLDRYGRWLDHPLSWEPNARTYPAKFARVFTAIADAPGPVLIHCAGGRDRTGMICSMLLVLADAQPEAVVDAYEQGFHRGGMYGGHGLAYSPASGTWVEQTEEASTTEAMAAVLEERRPALWAWLESFDVTDYLRESGVDAERLRRLRQTLR